MKMKLRLPALAVAALLAGCDLPFATYAAEVGYRDGGDVRWDIWGDFSSLDACRDAAVSRYNYYWAQNQRATSWACLKKNRSGGYESHHR